MRYIHAEYHDSALTCWQAIIKMLVDHGAHVDLRDRVLGYTPLMHAVLAGAEVAVQSLLDRVCHGRVMRTYAILTAPQGADPEAMTLRGETPLSLAATRPQYVLSTCVCMAHDARRNAVVTTLLERRRPAATSPSLGGSSALRSEAGLHACSTSNTLASTDGTGLLEYTAKRSPEHNVSDPLFIPLFHHVVQEPSIRHGPAAIMRCVYPTWHNMI